MIMITRAKDAPNARWPSPNWKPWDVGIDRIGVIIASISSVDHASRYVSSSSLSLGGRPAQATISANTQPTTARKSPATRTTRTGLPRNP